jgi:hypothetical protein
VLEDGRERRNSNASTDKDGDLDVEDVLRRRSVWTIDLNLRERTGVIDLHEVATRRPKRFLVLLRCRHRSLC